MFERHAKAATFVQSTGVSIMRVHVDMARPRRPEFRNCHLDLRSMHSISVPETQNFCGSKLWGGSSNARFRSAQVEVIGRAVYDFGGSKAVTT